MDSRRHNPSRTSSERKRLRDRKAQQTMRERREARIRNLEERVAFCEAHHLNSSLSHGPARSGTTTQHCNRAQTRHSSSEVERLRCENEILRARLGSLRNIVRSWDGDDWPRQQMSHGLVSEMQTQGPTRRTTGEQDIHKGGQHPNSNPTPHLHSSQALSASPSPSSSPARAVPLVDTQFIPQHQHQHQPLPLQQSPIWCLVPMDDTSAPFTPHCTWIYRPDLISQCPASPSPLALFHGSNRNWLADQIHRSTRLHAARDAERLAIGWLAYNYSRWRASPSPSTFVSLAPFQHPVSAQFQYAHPVGLDLLPWPQLRNNLVKNWHRYDYLEMKGYLSCCVKVRWPWGQDILERDGDDELRVSSEFLDVIMRESGWGLTGEFMQRYPELLEGMDVDAVRFHIKVKEAEPLQALQPQYLWTRVQGPDDGDGDGPADAQRGR